MNDQPLEFLAFHLYAEDSLKRKECPCRWGTLRDEIKSEYLNRAQAFVAAWVEDEKDAERRRNERDPRAYFVERYL